MVPRFIRADEKKIRQILINVLGNAIKFTKIGGVSFRVKGAGTVEHPELKVEIEDSGPGIPPEDLAHIFDSFQQSQAGREAGGTGLGLAISRQLAQMMGGTIREESVLGTGSIFFIEIPIQLTDESMVKAEIIPSEELWRLKPDSPPVRVLVVDDIADNRTLLRIVLESAGFQVQEATDGVEAIAAVGEWKPHAVLLDLRMPRMDGCLTAATLKADPATAKLPIIAVTASAFEEDKRVVAQAGFSGYVRKPFKPQEVLTLLRALLKLDYELKPPAPGEEGKRRAIIGQDAMRSLMHSLDAKIKSELRAALERGNMSQFKTALKGVESINPEFAAGLDELVNRYDYDRLGELLKP
jgi:CheY-like chemotaxis protein